MICFMVAVWKRQANCGAERDVTKLEAVKAFPDQLHGGGDLKRRARME